MVKWERTTTQNTSIWVIVMHKKIIDIDTLNCIQMATTIIIVSALNECWPDHYDTHTGHEQLSCEGVHYSKEFPKNRSWVICWE